MKENIHFKGVNLDTNEEFEGWYSPSCAVALYAFAKNKNGKWCMLANKRGEGCPDFNGYWNAPCGYLNWGEHINEAAVRECFEETGIKINDVKKLHLHSLTSGPESNHENVVANYVCYFNDTVERLETLFNRDNMEANEVDNIKFIPISELENYKWAFNQDKLINEIVTRYCTVNIFKKLIFKLYQKYYGTNLE